MKHADDQRTTKKWITWPGTDRMLCAFLRVSWLQKLMKSLIFAPVILVQNLVQKKVKGHLLLLFTALYSYDFFNLHDLSCVARVSAETPTQTHTISTWFLVIVVVESTSVFFTVIGATSCCFATGHIENHSVCRGHWCKLLWEKRKQDRRRSSKLWKLSTNNTFSKWPLAQIFGSLFLILLYFPFTDSKLNKGCSTDTEGGGREKKMQKQMCKCGSGRCVNSEQRKEKCGGSLWICS